MRTLSREQSRTVDRIAIEEYGMSGLVLMENAGRGVTDRLCELGIDGPVVICCGRGNNAGDGFVIARHLDLRGHLPWVLLWADPGELTGDAAENFRILRKTRVPILPSCEARDQTWLAEQLARANWIVDALLGTGARGNPRPPVDQVIAAINASGRRVLAVDLPSGLDCDTGEPGEPTVRAAVTCTFATAKTGFLVPSAAEYVGRLFVEDIGVPPEIVQAAQEVAGGQ